ncbi:MAG: hypothetical protein QOG04_181 [Actinomycetota bacterium]|jgi:transcriptional regulator with XRE-family HTH domain|nr:hypothetical protein [Actinomycetota bacterium]
MEEDEQERKKEWARFLNRIEKERKQKMWRLSQEQHRADLGLGYLVYCARRFSRLSQGRLATKINATQPSVSNWELGKRLPSLTALELVADAAGLELVIGLRDPGAPDLDKEFVVLGVCRDEGRVTELELFYDRYSNDYIPARPWRAEVEKMAGYRVL